MKKISDVISLNSRFCRSININQDLDSAEILSRFICPSSFEYALLNIVNNVKETHQAAFTWTGPYGSGKSSLAIFLSGLLGPKKEIRSLTKNLLRPEAQREFFSKISVKKGWKILPIVGDLQDIKILLEKEIYSKTHRRVSNIFNSLTALSQENDGLIIIIDEMGKCLESAAKGNGDVYFFQQLAEFASRSQGKIILIGILHQSFADYARYLPHSLRDEWLKIQGRFIDMPINTLGEEQIELISRAISSSHVSKKISKEVSSTIKNISKNKALADVNSLKKALDGCWPIHPVVVCLLAQISRKRFGQNQRSIFSFLSSSEPKGFRDFISSTPYLDSNMYMPDNLYDYIKFNLESAILASSDSKIWNMGIEALTRCRSKGASEEHLKILKTIILIDIFNGNSGITATKELLSSFSTSGISKILQDLHDWSIIIFKKHLNSYSVYEGSDFDIDRAMKEASSFIPSLDMNKLADIAKFKPIIAKRHYHKFGCMRWFDIILAPLDNYENFILGQKKQTSASGIFSIFLPKTISEKSQSFNIIKQKKGFSFPVFMTVAKDTQLINEYLKELLCLEWIQKNKNELHGDSIARREVESRKNLAISFLETQLNKILTSSDWYYDGERIGTVRQSELSKLASNACDNLYHKTPQIRSELVNRTKPSSSANTALNSLLKRMVLNEGEAILGIEGFTPERGLFNILLQETGLYRKKITGAYTYQIPVSNNLKKLWEATNEKIFASVTPTRLIDIYQMWEKPPFGVKAGLQKFLALSYILTQKDVLAVYKDGIYIPQVDDLLVDYMMKEPKTITFRLVSVTNESKSFLVSIAKVLNSLDERNILKEDSTPLMIARKLVQIVDALPPWVLKTKALSKRTMKFREIIKVANDPHKLLFEDLVRVFSGNNKQEFIANFAESMKELLDIYPQTMKEIALLLTSELDVPLATPTALNKLQGRARNLKGVTGNFRIEAFASRISTFDSSMASIAGIVSLANSKPAQDWIDLDIENAKKEILSLCTEFKKAELYTKVKNRKSSRQAIAFVTGIGQKSEIIEGEFDILLDSKEEVERVKQDISKSTKNIKNKNVLLAALVELTIANLKGKSHE